MNSNKKNSNECVANTKICNTFVLNNTSHASHLNSAPGLVFDFYIGN